MGNHSRVVQLLLQHKADVNGTEKQGKSALWIASLLGHINVISTLVSDPEMNINLQDSQGKTALMAASEHNHPEIVSVLLNGHAKPDVSTHSGKTPLLMAASFGYTKCMRYLIDGGADVNFRDGHGCTPLYMACQSGQIAAVNMLVSAKAEIDAVSGILKETPLVAAAYNGHTMIVRILLMKKADPMKVDRDGMSMLSAAAKRGHLHVIQVVYQHLMTVLSAEEMTEFVNQQNKDGLSPLHLACIGGHEDVVRYLVDTMKVDVRGENDSHKTALDLAVKGGHQQIVSILSPGMTLASRSKVVYTVSLWTHEDLLTEEQYPKLRKKLAKLFGVKKKDVSKIKIVKEDTGFKIVFGVVLPTMAPHPYRFESLFAEMIRVGRFQNALRKVFDLTMPMGVLHWNMATVQRGKARPRLQTM